MENKTTITSGKKVINTNKKHISNILKNKGHLNAIFSLMFPLLLIFLLDAIFMFVDTKLMIAMNPNLDVSSIKGIIFSYFKLFQAISLIYVVGTSMYYSYNYGKGDKTNEEIASAINNGMIGSLVVSLTLITILGLTASSYLNAINGISNSMWSEELIHQTTWYIFLFGLGASLLMTRMSYFRVLRVEGYTTQASLIQASFYIFALFFDWLFMGYFNYQMIGAGMAYLFAAMIQIIFTFIYIRILQKRNATNISFKLSTFKINWKVMLAILIFGMPACLWNIGFTINDTLLSIELSYIQGQTGLELQQLYLGYQLSTMFIQAIGVSVTTVIAMSVGYLVRSGQKQEAFKMMKLTSIIMILSNAIGCLIILSLTIPIFNMLNITNFSWELYGIWIMMMMSLSFFNAQGYMSTYIAATGQSKLAAKDILIKFFLIGIPLQLICFFGIFVPTNNAMYFAIYYPTWSLLSLIYLRYIYKKQINLLKE